MAPTYGMLQGKQVTVNMTEAVFESVMPSVRYAMKVVVRNVTMRGQRVRLVPPRNAVFTLVVQNDVELAPGLEMQAELQYYSDAPEDIENELAILVGRADSEMKKSCDKAQKSLKKRWPTACGGQTGSVGRSVRPNFCFAALRAVGRSVGGGESETQFF